MMRREKDDRRVAKSVRTHQLTMEAFGRAAGSNPPGNAPRNFIHSGDGKSFYSQGKKVRIQQPDEKYVNPSKDLRPGQSVFD